METKQIINIMKSTSQNISASIISNTNYATLRVFEFTLSLFGLIILSPIFLFIAFMIKRDTPGPVFYRGLRAGKNGEPFNILKFRTMYERPESYQGAKVTAQDDPRITPIGNWLRETKINELPQLWNVLKGDMSLVGPRPEDIDIIEKWPAKASQELLSVRPGITSPASIVYRDEESLLHSKVVMDSYLKEILPSKTRLDLLYVRNRSLMSDLDVIFWTLVALLPQLKGKTIPEHLLYWGPLSRFLSRYFNWFLADVLVAFIAIGVAGVIWRISAPLDLGIKLAAAIALIIALLLSLINSLLGLNRITWERARPMDASGLAVSSILVTITLYIANHFWSPEPLLPPNMLVVSGIFAFLGFVAIRYRSRLLTGLASRWLDYRGSNVSAISERVLIVGAEDAAQFSAWLLRSGTLAPLLTIVGMVDDDPRKMGTKVNGCQIIGRTKNIPELVEQKDIGLIMLAVPERQSEERRQVLSICRSTSARIVLMSDLLETLRAHFPLDDREGTRLSRNLIRQATTDRLTGVAKREHLFDQAQIELRRSHRYRRSLSVVMIDVDYQRDKEETVSCIIVDQILLFVAECCKQNLRESDILGRYSESEFAILLPETNLNEAKIVARRITESVMAGRLITDRGPVTLIVKLSFNTASDGVDDVGSLFSLCEPKMTLNEPEFLTHGRKLGKVR